MTGRRGSKDYYSIICIMHAMPTYQAQSDKGASPVLGIVSTGSHSKAEVCNFDVYAIWLFTDTPR